ncbi:MAG TPA: AAA family ATPase [Candidatus Corynebacterium avicola]|uniref:AAA family ATPase n=1 Tax=Candidatus Corynebacterium avicola TaxID=2838527 RepID=A0A9D1RP54_9CORY|nr:AAA family ATPase [Candidatus Corynebacterium avicola]
MLKITSLTLDHVAGVAHATVTVPEKGVMVVHGPNERGKSTVLKALRLLLSDTRFSSGKREVRELKDVSADEPPTITAELTVGEQELRITKSYKQGSGRCELTVTAPRTENLTGREASDRFSEILSQEVDADLLDALTIEQGRSMEMLEAAGLGPLEQALVAAPGGDGADGSEGTEDEPASTGAHDGAAVADTTSLITRITKERERYFTPTGRPARELDAAQKAVAAAQAEYDEATARYGQAQGLIEELGRLRADKDDILRQQPEAEASAEKAEAELAAGREAHAVLERHRAAVAQATEVLEVAQQRLQVRTEKTAELTEAAEAVTAAAQQVDEATEAATQEKNQEAEVRAQWEQARRTTAVATAYVNYLTAERDSSRARLSRKELAAQHKAAAEIAERLTAAEATVAENPATPDAVAELHRLAADRRRAGGVRDAAATTVQISGPAEGRVTVDGEETELDGDELTVGVTARREFGLGDYRVSVTPALDLKDIDDDVARAQTALAKALDDLGAESIEQAEESAERRRLAVEQVTQLRLELGKATGGLSVAELETKARQLDIEVTDGAKAIDVARESVLTADPDQTVDGQSLPGMDTLRAGGDAGNAAEDAAGDADGDVDLAEIRRVGVESERLADRLRDELDAIAKAGAVFRLASSEADLERETERRERLDKALTQARSEISDADLQTSVDTARTTLDTARASLQDATSELGDGADGGAGLADLDVLEGLAAGATTRVERLRERAEAIGHEISRANGALGEHAGVAERLEEASTTLERVSRQHRSVRERATAADLLYTTVETARTDARQRYEAPFRESFEKLARTLYGRRVEFEFDEDLTVSRRILDGTSLATSQLSGGAQEQIAVLSRLAVADIIGGGEAVPIVIDDALGFSDAGRAQRMNLVLAQLAAEHQIIVLTCDPARFDSVPGAHPVSMDSLRAAV